MDLLNFRLCYLLLQKKGRCCSLERLLWVLLVQVRSVDSKRWANPYEICNWKQPVSSFLILDRLLCPVGQ